MIPILLQFLFNLLHVSFYLIFLQKSMPIFLEPTVNIKQNFIISVVLTQRHSNAVSLGIQQTTDLREVAVALPIVLIHGAF